MKSIIKLGAFCFLLLIYSCATIVMPGGGPKDSEPPKVVRTYPEMKTIRFLDQRVILSFNEFVELNSPQTNISVSPYSPTKPKPHITGKNLILTFDQGLKPNTTYTIDLNNAIKDYNEGNLLSNYRLVFSTGEKLDSGRLVVGVNDAKTGLVSDMTKLCLVKNKSDFFGKNFKYVSNTSNGLADFSNLTNESFYIYAFVDSNMNMTWDKTEAIGFLNEPVKAGPTIHKIKLFQQSQKKTNFFVTPVSETEYFITASEDLSFPELLDSVPEIIKLSPSQLKLIVKSGNYTQSLRIKYNIDKYETLELPANKPSKYFEKLTNINERGAAPFSPDTIRIAFNAFINKIDTSKIKLQSGTTVHKASFSIQKNNLVIVGLDYGKEYLLSLDSQALYSSNRYNLPISQTISTYPKEKHFNEISITLDPNLASNRKARIFHIVENEWKPIDKQSKIRLNNLCGDEIKWIILIDSNNDGIWTTGDVEKDIQPEPLYIETIKLESKKTDYILKITNP